MATRFKTLAQTAKYLEVSLDQVKDLIRMGMLRVVSVGSDEMISSADIQLAKKWLEEDQNRHPVLALANLAARMRVVERQLEALVQYVQPPMTVSMTGIDDDELDSLVEDLLTAGDDFNVVDALKWVSVITALDWSILTRIEKRYNLYPGWKLFAELLMAVDSWWNRRMSRKRVEQDLTPSERLLPVRLAEAKRVLRELILIRDQTDTIAFLEEHPRKIVASMLTPPD